jgi:ABC-type Fe3+/spermidine/putrescine transport system ATPase subunit
MNAPHTPKPILKVTDISNKYGGTPLLQDVNFSLNAGEILCLLGPSGSGKTTLLRLIAGLEEEYSGQVVFKGKNIRATPAHKRGFGLMFQEYALFPHKNIEENIRFGLEMQNIPTRQQRHQVEAMLELVGLSGFGKRRINELSGGERQRVALARSLAPKPQLLLLDEPLGSLDRTLRERLTVEIRAILKELGVTAIFVTHDQNEAFGVADKIAILKNGILQQFAPPEQLYRFPSNIEVAHFLGFTNIFQASVDRKECVVKSEFGFRKKVDKPSNLPPSPMLLLRPDGARLGDSENNPPPRAITIAGTLIGRRYQGSTFNLTIKCESEYESQTLHFDLPLEPAPPAVGAKITLTVEPSAQVIIEG